MNVGRSSTGPFALGAVRLGPTAVIVATLTAVAALVAVRTTAGSDNASRAKLNQLSAAGIPVTVSLPEDLRALGRMHRDQARATLLRTADDRSYYRVVGGSSGDCFAVGPAVPVAFRFGQIACSERFPSAAQPILDFTFFGGRPAALAVGRSEGFAADGIASVALRDENRSVVAEVPVRSNSYSFPRPPSGSVAEIVALDADGNAVYSHSYRDPQG
jgi:hypothetical protein